MKICAVQHQPVTGDIAANIERHLQLIDAAASHGAQLVYFSELSLTGYEPRLAERLAATPDEPRLEVFQQRSDALNMRIGVGLPMQSDRGVQIGMLWFDAGEPRRRYAKQLLHSDELPYFVAGHEQLTMDALGHTLAPAICYESLQDPHVEQAARLGADVYLASVAKSTRGVQKAATHYPAIARRLRMFVIMANCVGPADDFVAAGRSAAWGNDGQLLAELDAQATGLVILDTQACSATAYAV